jgi:hypothetical protein
MAEEKQSCIALYHSPVTNDMLTIMVVGRPPKTKYHHMCSISEVAYSCWGINSVVRVYVVVISTSHTPAG